MSRIPILLLALAACSKTPTELAGPEPPSGPKPAESTAAAPPTPTARSTPDRTVTMPALQWDDPSRWQRRKPSSQMRIAEYAIPHAAADTDDGECTVITFGPGQGGSVDDNIERWVKQLAPATSAPVRTNRTVRGMAVARVEVGGTFTPMKMPGGPAVQGPHSGWRLIGFVVEAPTASWFFKLTGPDATVKAAAKEIDAMIDSAHSPEAAPKASR